MKPYSLSLLGAQLTIVAYLEAVRVHHGIEDRTMVVVMFLGDLMTTSARLMRLNPFMSVEPGSLWSALATIGDARRRAAVARRQEERDATQGD